MQKKQKLNRSLRYHVLSGAAWPIAPLAVGLGIMFGEWHRHWQLWPLYLAIAFFFALFAYRRSTRVKQILLLTAFFFLGLGRLSQSYEQNPTGVLPYRYYGEISGRVIDIDQSYSGALRLTLDQVQIERPILKGNVRVSLHGDYAREEVKPGAIVRVIGHLSPPSGPAEPLGYNFRKRAWVDGLAAVGYTRKPLTVEGYTKLTPALKLLDFRLNISRELRETLGAKTGGFAAAIFVGDRSEIDAGVVEDMRRANLAHLLAISGMHMGAVCALAFFALNLVFTGLRPFHNYTTNYRLAIFGALFVTTLYWLVSGMAYSASRAYLMAILMFGALAFSRRALSMRNVALVGVAILIIDPLALGHVGFQMSFAATAALILFFRSVPMHRLNWPPFLKWLAILMATSLVAGTATAPFAAFHFNTVPKYGLIANILAVPVMSFVVLPAGMFYALLEPIGLGAVPLKVAGWGIDWILFVGHKVAGIEGAVWNIPAAPAWALGAMVLAGYALAFGGRGGRLAFLCLFCAVFFFWQKEPRPLLLVADTGRFFGLMEEDGLRKYSRATGHNFVANIWAKGDGVVLDQEAHALPKADPMVLNIKDGWRLVFTTTQKGAALMQDYCAPKTIIIAAQSEWPEGGCRFFNQYHLLDLGGMAIEIEEGELIVIPNIPRRKMPWSGYWGDEEGD